MTICFNVFPFFFYFYCIFVLNNTILNFIFFKKFFILYSKLHIRITTKILFIFIICFWINIYLYIYNNLTFNQYFGITNKLINDKIALVFKYIALWGLEDVSLLCFISYAIFFFNLCIYFICKNFDKLNFFLFFYSKIKNISYILFYIFFILFFLKECFYFSGMFLTSTKQLNPILQDIGMLYHPPLIFCGYSCIILIYYFLQLFIKLNLLLKILKLLFFFLFKIIWIIFSCGLILGSWWAFYELNWGGFWFWDNVEILSLLFWSFLIIFFHYSKNLLLFFHWYITECFFLCGITLLFIRGNLIFSVHTFNNSTDIYLFSLGFILLFFFNKKNTLNIFFYKKKVFQIFSLFLKNFFLNIYMYIIFLLSSTLFFFPYCYYIILNHFVFLTFKQYNIIFFPCLIIFVCFYLFKFIKTLALNFINISLLFGINWFFFFLLIHFKTLLFFEIQILCTICITFFGIIFHIFLFYKKRTELNIIHFFFILALFFLYLCSLLKINFLNIIKYTQFSTINKNIFIQITDINFLQLKLQNPINFNINLQLFNQNTGLLLSQIISKTKLFFIENIFIIKPNIVSNFLFDFFCFCGDGTLFFGYLLKIILYPFIFCFYFFSLICLIYTIIIFLKIKN